jgi:predicted nucleotidyltransferase
MLWRMHPLIEKHYAALVALCQRYRVARLDLFGSATHQGFDPATSDLDFLVEFEDLAPSAYARAYFGLLEGLQALFSMPVDLVSSSSITNPFFRESVERTRTRLYAD